MSPKINWGNIGAAVSWYEKRGYYYNEAHWTVSPEAISVTIPTGAKPVAIPEQGVLVGSAEQSFIQKMLDGTSLSGRYVSASPCFRDDLEDTLHQRHFFKVELIEMRKTDFKDEWIHASLGNMAGDALDFFRSLPGGSASYIRHTETGLDIELRGVELGSYGIRRHGEWVWVYGTGYADPRFSVACSL